VVLEEAEPTELTSTISEQYRITNRNLQQVRIHLCRQRNRSRRPFAKTTTLLGGKRPPQIHKITPERGTRVVS
jgi:hypothetical protein